MLKIPTLYMALALFGSAGSGFGEPKKAEPPVEIQLVTGFRPIAFAPKYLEMGKELCAAILPDMGEGGNVLACGFHFTQPNPEDDIDGTRQLVVLIGIPPGRMAEYIDSVQAHWNRHYWMEGYPVPTKIKEIDRSISRWESTAGKVWRPGNFLRVIGVAPESKVTRLTASVRGYYCWTTFTANTESGIATLHLVETFERVEHLETHGLGKTPDRLLR